jgi:hypothetical protein
LRPWSRRLNSGVTAIDRPRRRAGATDLTIGPVVSIPPWAGLEMR